MELFARCDREPERLLAVTEGGRRYTLGNLNAAAGRLAEEMLAAKGAIPQTPDGVKKAMLWGSVQMNT